MKRTRSILPIAHAVSGGTLHIRRNDRRRHVARAMVGGDTLHVQRNGRRQHVARGSTRAYVA